MTLTVRPTSPLAPIFPLSSLLTLILVNSYLHSRPGTLRERLRRIPCRQHERVLRYHCSHICRKGRCRRKGRDGPVRLSAVHCTSISRPILCVSFLQNPSLKLVSRGPENSPITTQQTCQNQNNLNEICGSLANRTCACQNYDLVRAIGFCEAANCSVADNSSKSYIRHTMHPPLPRPPFPPRIKFNTHKKQSSPP